MSGLVNVSKSRRDDLKATIAQVLRENPDPNPELQPYWNDESITFKTDPHPEQRTADGVIVVNPCGVQVGAISKFAIQNPQGGGTIGRKVAGRSNKSRKRLMRHLMSVDLESLAAERKKAKYSRTQFVTLTYPQENGLPFTDWERGKEHINTLRKRLERKYGLVWAVWVQEHQKSGALHFHLVLVLPKVVNLHVFRAWIAQAWFEVVGSGNPDHFKAGTSVEAVYIEQSQPGNLLSYLSKELGGSGKAYQVMAFNPETGETLETGKTWGIWGRDEFNAAKVIVCEFVIRGREAWQRFKENVAATFAKSRYLRTVADLAWWGGGLLYGNGGDLMNKLLDGIPDGAWEYV